MKPLSWVLYKLRCFSKDAENDMIHYLEEEIKELKAENSMLKGRVIPFKVRDDKKAYFEFYDEDIERKIIENLKSAEREVEALIAWFTSERIMNELKKLKKRGVKVSVAVDESNSGFYDGKLLECSCDFGKVRFPPPEKKGALKSVMHNKYCIIDGRRVIDGSYNWTKHARYNMEHIVIIDNEYIAGRYRENFKKICASNQYVDRYHIYHDI